MRSTIETARLTTRSARARRVAARTALAAAGALIYAGVTASSALATQATSFGVNGGPNVFNAPSIGSPPPGGIYAPFTDCPLHNPLMEGSVGGLATGCIASISTSGTFTISGIPTPITHPVIVQFGVWDPPNASPNQFSGGVLQPADGRNLVDSPEQVPGGLPLLLLCPGSTPGVAALCRQARTSGQTEVAALVESAGPITDFELTTFTQPVKIKLINPLLGGNCYIGSDNDPIVLHPTIISGTLAFVPDPDPIRFPTTVVLEILDAQATDDTFSVPVARGCGPGGVANAAINTLLGLPSPSGKNHLLLNGNSYFADDFSDANQADDLLAAFRASVGVASPSGAFLD
jgi:hypothetical protein